MIDTIVQWATILSPIIAVLIAVWVTICSKKDTDKQIESIKALSRQQIDASIKQVELEIEKNLFYAKQAKQEWEEIYDINHSGMAHIVEAKKIMMERFHENKPERDYKLYCQFIKDLEGIKQGLVSNKNKMS